jgi:hypothetical protein
MPIDFETVLFLTCQDSFSYSITVTPVVSQPAQAAYPGRAIYNTRETMVQTDVGMAILSDQETILDILVGEYPIPPCQGDQINIPQQAALPDDVPGDYEIVSTSSNGAGQLTLLIRKYEPAAP